MFDYFSMMMLNSVMQQLPVITSANLVSVTIQSSSPPSFDPQAEIRNGWKRLSMKYNSIFIFSSTTKSSFSMASTLS